MLFDSNIGGGFGATPFGTFFGAGLGQGLWGLFTGTFHGSTLQVVCESCHRVRTQKRLGGIAAFGTFIDGNKIVVVASDVAFPVTCYFLKFVGPDGEFDVPLSFRPGMPPSIIAPTPGTVLPLPPPGAPLVDTMLEAVLPEVDITGSYVVTLVDRCCGCETPLVTITLEAPPMIFTPHDADLGGAPIQWLDNAKLELDAGQPAGSARFTIPFDKCVAVLEFDARLGTLPDLQGWTRMGTGPAPDWALIEGGALRLGTTSPNTNYYEKALTLGASPTQAFAYASMMSEDIPTGSPGHGLDVQALYGPNGSPYYGARFGMRENRFWLTKLDSSAEQAGPFTTGAQWRSFCAGNRATVRDVRYEGPNAFVQTPYFGTIGLAAATELRARFGNTGGSPTLVGYFRNVVISAEGRFIRAGFIGYTPVAAPVLRLYVAADTNGSVAKTVRFRINYGPGTGLPNGPLPLSVGATINMVTPNTVYEVTIALPSLTANLPMWFTVERDWAHGDDKLVATAHLIQASLRSQ
jgi:hypothetical protein